MKVVKATSRATQRGPAEWFTGIVWLDEIGVPEPPSRLRVHSVTFEPGARTAWHAHPLGQILHITHGKGRVGRGSGEVHEVQAGDTIYIDPGERHWHGAAPAHLMTHLAVQEAAENGDEATWFAHVGDDEYR